ncbi:MAG: hypothetical protein ACI35S_09940 [Anaeroplasma sp.]
MKIEYKLYNPAGNVTALVIGDKYNLKQRKLINYIIMEKESNVEQVGFLSREKAKLTMAGGEFCGNAARCATLHYIGKENNIELEINNIIVKTGIDKNKKIWCEIPIEEYKIIKLQNKIYKIILKGITLLVIKENIRYKNLKQKAINIIKNYNINDDAIGVIFAEKKEKYIKIYPVVLVQKIDTIFLENACGSGTIAVSMLESLLEGKSNKYSIKQPSEEFLETEIIIINGIIKKAILKGKIKADNKIRKIII